jgi:uncharacterized lipoprotein YajG
MKESKMFARIQTRNRRFLKNLLLVAITALIAGCSSTTLQRPTSLSVPLELRYKPDSNPIGLALPQSRVYIMAINDQRDETDKIGENRQQQPYVPILPAGPEVPNFLHAALREQLAKGGLTIVENPDEADRIISVTLKTLWAQESPDYHATISTQIEIRDPNGKLLWSNAADGDGAITGGSLNVQHYQEVLTAAIFDLLHNLDLDWKFRQALNASSVPMPQDVPQSAPSPMQ